MPTPRRQRRGGNYVAEWFGHRVYPVVATTDKAITDQERHRCPFITAVTGQNSECVKPERSKGVCTISSTSNGERQDWLVCPYRALNLELLDDAVSRLFRLPPDADMNLVAAPVLADPTLAHRFRTAVHSHLPSFVYFQNKLGGEISLSSTERSPELSFDATIIEILPDQDTGLAVGRYGIFEIQTMDFHGTYASAVANMTNALHLHKHDFGRAVTDHPDWLGERVEGPNIANVFKRTFYQMMFKFQIATHGSCVGCIFAVPRAVWDSWQRHLGRPDLVAQPDGTFRLAVPQSAPTSRPPAWIYVFDTDVSDTITPNDIRLWRTIGTDAASLSHYALDVAPAAALEQGASADRLLDTIRARLATYLPELRHGRPTQP